jgi:hypothetical protein
VGPGVNLETDLQDGMSCFVRQKLIRKKLKNIKFPHRDGFRNKIA